MIEGVESMKDDMVRVIYNKKNQKGVDFIVQHLQENVIAAFGEKIANEMLGENFDVITQYGSEMEHQHAMKIKLHGKENNSRIRNHLSSNIHYFMELTRARICTPIPVKSPIVTRLERYNNIQMQRLQRQKRKMRNYDPWWKTYSINSMRWKRNRRHL